MGLDPSKQIDQYGHDSWTSQHGLPGEAVYQILQSRDGYLWLRTSAGLVRFDGVRFVVMDSEMGSEQTAALAMSADGDLLIRTTTRTVVYKDGVFSDYRQPAALPDGGIKTVFETRQHEVLLGSDNFIYGVEQNKVRLVKSGTAAITAFLQDHTGRVWAGASADLYTYRNRAVADSDTLPAPQPISALLEDHQHRIWVGTSVGLYLVNPEEREKGRNSAPHFSRVEAGALQRSVNALAEDREGNLWVGTSDRGLARIRDGKLTNFGSSDSLTDNLVESVFEDREGSLWVGTASGLDRFRDTKATTYTMKEGLPSNTTTSAVAARDGSIYVFCDSGGLARIDRGVITAWSPKDVPGLKVFYGSAMAASKDGSVWLGTVGGLTHLKDGKFTEYGRDAPTAKNYVSAIAEDDEGLIVATSDSLALRFKDGKSIPFTVGGRTTPLSVSSYYTFTIYRDPAGTLWFGTVKGLFKFKAGQSPSKAQQSSVHFAVTSIADDGKGSLWLGGRTPGLTRFRIADGRVTTYKEKQGLFDGAPSRVLFDANGNLWISTANGILMADRGDLDAVAEGRGSYVRTVVYDTNDGMKTSEPSAPTSQPGGARGPDGRLWFTTSRGVVVIDPAHIPHNGRVPPVVIENVVVDDQTLPGSGQFSLAPGKAKIEFHYTALSLLVPERVRFKYKLEGYDHDWVDAGQRRVAYYTNLPPGPYRFRVIAANDDGVWNYAGASVGFALKPHFYQTKWFDALCGLSILLAAIAGHRLNTRLFRARAAELSRLVEERTAELRESQRHLEQVAFLDSLTALPNRRMFTQEFRKLQAVTKRNGARFSLLMIDLDQFKQVNDTLGHDAGDALLVESAIRLKLAVRESDCVARLGGDEFAILVPEDQEGPATDVICQRIIENFVSDAPFNGALLRTTPSIGIATFPDDGESQETLCKSADLALYEAKRAGGNGWRWFHSHRTTPSAAAVALSDKG